MQFKVAITQPQCSISLRYDPIILQLSSIFMIAQGAIQKYHFSLIWELC